MLPEAKANRQRATRKASSSSDAGNRYEIAVVADSLRLLRYIFGHGAVATGTAAEFLGVSRSTAYRILMTLSQYGFVDRNTSPRLWTPGLQVGGMLSRLVDERLRAVGERLRSVASPSMRRLLAEIDETVNLAVYAGGEARFAWILESSQMLRTSDPLGAKAPLHASAMGKAILAALAPADCEMIIDTLVLDPITDSTITDKDALLEELTETRERGWAVDRSEVEIGVACFGAALRGANGQVIGALAVGVPDVRLQPGYAELIGRRVMEEAARINLLLGSEAERGED